MKKLLKVALVALCVLFAGNYAKAQAKIGHLNFNSLIEQMPEAKTIQTQLEAYQKQFYDQNVSMTNELQTKGKDYETKRASMTEAARGVAENELVDMQKRLQEFQADARNKMEEKRVELSKPLITKARTAVSTVAKEKGYTYVFDSSTTDLIVSPAADDMLAAVKLKLGLK